MATHLEGPKYSIAYDIASRILKLFVSAQFDDAIQQIARESSAPQADEDSYHKLTTLIGLGSMNGTKFYCYC